MLDLEHQRVVLVERAAVPLRRAAIDGHHGAAGGVGLMLAGNSWEYPFWRMLNEDADWCHHCKQYVVHDASTGSKLKVIVVGAILATMAAAALPIVARAQQAGKVIGVLMPYGANLSDLNRRPATYVDKILKGTKAGDLPVEQPTNFILRINLKTAKVLGLNVPPRLLALADEAIE